MARKFSTAYEHVRHQNIAGIDYITFQTDNELSGSDVSILSDLSFAYALFEIETLNGNQYLRPIKPVREDFVDESISTIMKYTGKTNELFTRMMINVAFYSQDNQNNIKLLDPLAGKGTTLYEGLMKGYNVYGIEISDQLVNESYHFVKRFLETARYKFDYSSMKISGPKKSFSALRHSFETARTKEDFKSKQTRAIEMIAGNSLYADKFFKKHFFDMIVGDLPYGVQHGNITNKKQTSLTRNPAELLNACLPSWMEVLKPEGIIVLAWNSHVLSRDKMEQLFEDQGLTVKKDDAYLQFEHRVDQSILRDIIVAVKK